MRRALVIALLVVGVTPLGAASEPPALAKARALYNVGDYEAAIDAAAVARQQAEWADAAALVMARAHLERYRQFADPAELALARETLVTIRHAALTPRDQVDLLIGLGQSLYLGEIYGAAAELFDTALNEVTLLSRRDRLLLVDWWATALDREAQSRSPERRTRVYDRIVARMEEELRADASSAVANYWLAVAARGTGDIERAWHAAVAGWVRSTLTPDSVQDLRADLDRLVIQALIPERVRQHAPAEQEERRAALRAEWDLVKQHWP